VIYVIENNRYAMGTAIERGSALAEELYHRGSVFGIPGEQVDGMDVAAVKDAGERALARARRGEGPKILEMRTYRYRGHSMSDPAKYRTREEVQEIREHHDPIDLLRNRILEEGRASEADLKEIDREIRAVVNEAAEFAQADPEPDPAELYTDVTAT
jgi:pyruvate dehydrogenase E1 component alpha subunit